MLRVAEDSKAAGHHSGNVRPHGGFGVQVDPDVMDRGCRLNEIRAYSDQCSSWGLMPTSA